MSTQKNTTFEWRCYGWTDWASTFFWLIPCGYDMTKRASYTWFVCQNILWNFIVQPHNMGGCDSIVTLGTAPQARSLGVWFPMVSVFIDIILLAALWPWDQLSLKQKWVPGIFPGGVGKGGQLVELTTLWPSYADCFEVWNPQHSGTLSASLGLYRDCCIFTYRMMALGWILGLNSWQG
jgi:hypothetical protein